MAREKASKSLAPYTARVLIFAFLQLLVTSLATATADDLQPRDGGATIEQRHYVAYSLTAAEAMVRKALQDHTDFRKDQTLFKLGGMNKPKALFFDSKSKEWILLGERSGDTANLTLDDFVVALRTRFLHPDIDPGVTIDPIIPDQPNAIDDPATWGAAKQQRVKFFGSLEDTEFGLTCFEADLLMKRVGLGLTKFTHVPIPSLFDLFRNSDVSSSKLEITSRFWLCPDVNAVPVLRNEKAIFIQELVMFVNRQTLFAEQGGKAVLNQKKMDELDVAGKKFAAAFTSHYDEAAIEYPILERLRGLARLAGLAKGVVAGKWTADFAFFLNDYEVARVEIPPTIDVLQNEDRNLGESLRGGVVLRNLAIRLRSGDITALTEAVVLMRPNNRPIAWEFLYGDTFLPLPIDAALGLGAKSDLQKLTSAETRSLRKAAEDGDVEAMLTIAEAYLDGDVGLPKDLEESSHWIHKAADQGNAEAECRLADCFARGIGVRKDIVEALNWFHKSADEGNCIAQFNLGVYYANGEGVQQDQNQSIMWYRKAAESGLAEAQREIADRYALGEGLAQDWGEAAKWYRKAAEQGHDMAQFNLAVCYAKGDGVNIDQTEAVRWYRKAAEQGYVRAQFLLGDRYRNGLGVERDLHEAAKWYRRAADKGDAAAQYNIGVLCYKGLGTSQDADEALMWFHKAAEQGFVPALVAIDKLER